MLGLAATACGAAPRATPAATATTFTPTSSPASGTLTISDTQAVRLRVTVQIAATPDSRARGLMGVTRLSDAQGMVFVFPTMNLTPFWMKDTVIPLDIAFWSSDGTIVDVQQMQPCHDEPCPLYTPRHAFIDSVEVAGGLLARAGVSVGDHATLTP